MALTQQEWQTVHTLAQDLARDVDRNELGKVVAYFRLEKSRDRFLELLECLPASPLMRRSGKTRGYYQRIGEVCRQHLQAVPDAKALEMVAWAFRLVTYYATLRGTRTAEGRVRRSPRQRGGRRR
jgi:hypothetical protein